MLAHDLSACSFMCRADVAPESIQIDIDTEAFRAIGGRYLMSVSRIRNADDLELDLRGVFENERSAWRIFLYTLSSPL